MDAAKIRKLKDTVLGKRYDLSVAFLTSREMHKAMLYKRQRAHTTSNVLAFPLSKTSGEILICKKAAKPRAFTLKGA
jgi:ssRNA-specific RNase YbeY (16S rRNA maturation enzyme)